MMLMFSGFSIGAAIGRFVATGLIQKYGWQSVFWVEWKFFHVSRHCSH